MKKTFLNSLITSFALILLVNAPAYGQSLATTIPVQKDAETVPDTKIDIKKLKTESLLSRKQKIETDTRNTIGKLDTVINRTQNLIDLLNKSNKDTTDAALLLTGARDSLEDANTYIDQFSATTTEIKIDTKVSKVTVLDEKTINTSLKETLKKVEESLRKSKTAIISSITILKTGITNNETN
jgi:hypothetical protein